MAAVAVDSVGRLYKDLEATYNDAMDGVQKAADEAVASVTFPIFNFPEGHLAPAKCWKILYLLKPVSPSYARPVRKKNIRRRRCNKCKGCLKEDCGSCYECHRKKKSGGKESRKGSCKKKKCLNPLLSSAARCLICTQTSTVSALTDCSRCGEILHPRCVAVLGEKVSSDSSGSQTWMCPKCCQCKTGPTKGRTYSGPLLTLLENSVLLAGFTDYLARCSWGLGLCDADSLGWGNNPGEILSQLAGVWMEHLPIAKKGLSEEDFEGLVVSLEDSVAVLEWYGLKQGMFDGLVALARRMLKEKAKTGYWKGEDPFLKRKTELPKRKRDNRKTQNAANKSPRCGLDGSSPLENSSLFRLLTSACSSADSSPEVLASDICSPESTTDNTPSHIQPANKTTTQVEDKQTGEGRGSTDSKPGDCGTPSNQTNSPDSDPFPQFSRKSDSAFPSTWYFSSSDSDSEDYLPTPPRCLSPQPSNQTNDISESEQPMAKRPREDSTEIPATKAKGLLEDYINDALDVMFQHAHPGVSNAPGSIRMPANNSTGMEAFQPASNRHFQGHVSGTASKKGGHQEFPPSYNYTRSPTVHTDPTKTITRNSPNTGFEIRPAATCPCPTCRMNTRATTQSVPSRPPALRQQEQPSCWDPPINEPFPQGGQCPTRYGSICSCAACCRQKATSGQGKQPHYPNRASFKMQRSSPADSRHITVANIPPVRSRTPKGKQSAIWHASSEQLQPVTNKGGTSSHCQGSCRNNGSSSDMDVTQPLPTSYRASVHVSLTPQGTTNKTVGLGWKVQGHPTQSLAPLADRNRYFPNARHGGKKDERKEGCPELPILI